ncbi:MAG: serine/threonine-protein kinase, partial [Planctomycetota bacterium]|nr:serine/threonine-protein kinase [Planctomycetota bacterium]
MDYERDDNEENGLSAAEMVFARLLSGNTSIEEAVDRACDSDPKLEPALRRQLNKYLQRRQQRLQQKNSSEEKKPNIEGLAGLILDKYSADLDINYSFISDNEVPMTPEFDGRYDLLEEIARGGMGAIFSIKDPVLQRELAMKVVLGNEEGQAPPQRIYRFLREARITARLSHPGIVPVHELNSDNEGRYYFTMDRINGKELRDVMIAYNSGDPKWDLNRLLEVILHVCDTLEFAHDWGVIHRDIKPSNIMVGKFGEVYVMDWGLARQIDGPEEDPLMDFISEKFSNNQNGSTIVTKDGAVVGTPSYMSPEQASPETSEMGPWTDVYAVGALLYEILTGSPPYRNREKPLPGQKVLKLLKEGPPEDVHKLAPDAPEDLIQICKIAMQRDPKDRPKDCGEISQMIRKVQRSRAKDARITKEAKDNARKSKAVNQFLTSLFINPEEENPTLYGLNAHKLLELGAGKLLSEDPGEAEIQVTLISTLASIFLETGDPVRAESLLEKECVIRREHSHWPGEDLIAALRKLATAQKALRKLEKTESTLQEAIEQKVLSQDQPLFTEVQQELADLLNLRGDWFQAEEMFRDLILNLGKDKSSKKIQALLGLSRCYSYQGDWEESKKNLALAMDIATKSRSEEICPELPELLFEKAGLFLESQRDN